MIGEWMDGMDGMLWLIKIGLFSVSASFQEMSSPDDHSPAPGKKGSHAPCLQSAQRP
jgi:hypothetical protein